MKKSTPNIIDMEEPLGKKVWIKNKKINVELKDGRVISVPLTFYPLLLETSPEILSDYQFFGDGSTIYFPQLDEYLSVEGLLEGRKQNPALYPSKYPSKKSA